MADALSAPTLRRPATALARRRKRMDRLVGLFAYASTAIGLFFLGWLLVTLIGRGAAAFDIGIFTKSTAPPGSGMSSIAPSRNLSRKISFVPP